MNSKSWVRTKAPEDQEQIGVRDVLGAVEYFKQLFMADEIKSFKEKENGGEQGLEFE